MATLDQLTTDVTELHAKIQELDQRVNRLGNSNQDLLWFKSILENIQDAVIVTNPDGKIIYWNSGATEIFGFTEEEMIGRYYYERFKEPIRSQVQQWIQKILLGAEFNGEWKDTRKDGSPVWIDSRVGPLIDSQGTISGLIGVSRDISVRKKLAIEKELMERKIHDTQRLESLGVLAGGIAHRFNNLLTGILGNTRLVEKELQQKSTARNFLKEIESSALRAVNLSRKMLDSSGKGGFVPQLVDINRLLWEGQDLMSLFLSPQVELKFELGENLPEVVVDKFQIRQLVINLIANASEAMEKTGGSVKISTRLESAEISDFSDALLSPEFSPGQHLVLEVCDTGPGIPEDLQTRIFDPFFTTKFTGRGLGLSEVLGVVRSHWGGMQVASHLGKGATFRIFLRLGNQFSKNLSDKSLFQTRKTVLLVDDEEAIRQVARQMLQLEGFDVIQAADGFEALHQYHQYPGKISLILLDLNMPHLDGEKTFATLRNLKSEVPIIVMSGFKAEDLPRKVVDLGMAGYLQKPFRYRDMVAVLKKVPAECEHQRTKPS